MKRTLILTAMLSAMVTLHAQGIKFGLIAGVDVSNPTNGAEMTKLGYRFGMKAESDFSNNTFLNVSVLLASNVPTHAMRKSLSILATSSKRAIASNFSPTLALISALVFLGRACMWGERTPDLNRAVFSRMS